MRYLGLAQWLSSKERTCNTGAAGSAPGFPEGGHGNPPQYSCLKKPVNRGTWQATVHRTAKSWTRLKWLSMHIQT